jgi:hypothetical protein
VDGADTVQSFDLAYEIATIDNRRPSPRFHDEGPSAGAIDPQQIVGFYELLRSASGASENCR